MAFGDGDPRPKRSLRSEHRGNGVFGPSECRADRIAHCFEDVAAVFHNRRALALSSHRAAFDNQ
jgi:hypothetical protein